MALACPDCGSTSLRSVEQAEMLYDVTLTRDANGALQYDYSGESELLYETAEPTGAFWCPECDRGLDEDELVDAAAVEV